MAYMCCAFLAAILLAVVEAQDTCYAKNGHPYLNFGSKTAYEHAHNKKGIPPVPDCKPVQLWLLSRHGTRWPSVEDIPEFTALNDIKNHVISNYNSNKGSLCLQDIDNLRAWQFSMSPDQGDQLTIQGRQDLYFLGRRIRHYFPDLLNTSTYNPEKFIFRHTDTARTKESAEYFARGVLGLSFEDSAPQLPDAVPDDRLIYPYNNCPVWDSLGEESKEERKKFDQSEYMNKVVYSVSQRLGFDYNLTRANVKDIYDGCRYTKAWNVSGTSPWCAAFTDEELKIMEYAEDVKYYYKSGPGTPMNLKLACPLVKDMVERFNAVESAPQASQPTGVFYFSHATMVDMLTARLGLLGDSHLPLTADNYPQQKYRQFLTSHIIPFSGNVLAVLYNCSRGESPLQTIFYQSEEIVAYPGCSVGLCKWSYIKDVFSSFIQDSACTDSKYCFDKSQAAKNTISTAVPALLLMLYCLTH